VSARPVNEDADFSFSKHFWFLFQFPGKGNARFAPLRTPMKVAHGGALEAPAPGRKLLGGGSLLIEN